MCFFISKRLKPGSWSIIFHFSNLITLCLKTSCSWTINLHNFYNPVAHTGKSQLPILENTLAANLEQEQIVVGDSTFIILAGEGLTFELTTDLKILLSWTKPMISASSYPRGQSHTKKWGPGKSTIDLIYSTDFLSNSVIKCNVSEIDHHSNHLPVEIHFQISLAASIPNAPQKNWKKINPDTFSKAVIKYVQGSPFFSPPPSTNFDCSTEGLNLQIQSVANRLFKAPIELAPDLKICARLKAGFNEERKEVQIRARRLKKA